MNTVFDTIEEVDKCIAEVDIEKLTEILEQINFSQTLGYNQHDYMKRKTLFSIITSNIKELIYTKPEFYENDDFVNKFYTLISNYYGPFFMGNYQELFYFKDLLLLIKERAPHRIKSINAVLRILRKCAVNTSCEIMMNIIVTAFIYKDYELIDNIVDEMGDSESIIHSIVYTNDSETSFQLWVLVFMNLLIENEFYGALDKVTAVVYGNNDFIDIKAFGQLTESSWIKILRFLYKRYKPEITDTKIGEMLINKSSLWDDRSMYDYMVFPSAELTKNELLEISELGVKVDVLNKLVPYLDYFSEEEITTVLSDFIDDEAIFYINDSRNYTQIMYGTIIQIIDKKPGIKISIDDNKYYEKKHVVNRSTIALKSKQVKAILSERALIATEPIDENPCIRTMIKFKNPIIFTLLDKLELSGETCEKLAELCVEHRNLDLLKRINECYSK